MHRSVKPVLLVYLRQPVLDICIYIITAVFITPGWNKEVPSHPRLPAPMVLFVESIRQCISSPGSLAKITSKFECNYALL